MRMNAFVKRCMAAFEIALKKSRKPRRRTIRLPRIHIEDLEIRCFLSASYGLATVIQPDGKTLVVGATADLPDGNKDFAIARLNVDGTPDMSFSGDGQVVIPFNLLGAQGGVDVATCVAIQEDGKIVLGGYAQANTKGDYDFAAVRLHADGTLDQTFGIDGRTTVAFQLGGDRYEQANGIAIAPDGKIVLAGTAVKSRSGDSDFAVARLTPSGFLDTTFDRDGKKTVPFNAGGNKTDEGTAVVVQPNGAVVVAGSAQRNKTGDYDFAVTRLTSKGALDKSFAKTGKRIIPFNLGGGRDDGATSVALQGTDIVLGGFAQVTSAGNFDFAVAKVKSDGTLDKTFSGDGLQTIAFDQGGVLDDEALAIAPMADGRLVLGGFVQLTETGNFDYAVTRITPTGALDPSFGVQGSVRIPIDLVADGDDAVYGVAIDSTTGNIIAAGTATTADQGGVQVAVARLTSTGILDKLFSLDGLTTIQFNAPELPV